MASKRTFKIELEVTVDESTKAPLAELARRHSSEEGANVDDALMEILHRHPLFDQPGVELTAVTLLTGEQSADWAEPETGALEEEGGGESTCNIDLDQFESGIYAYRWPNGDCSIVCADCRRDAIMALDEWAEAHPSNLHSIDAFMADFKLGDDGEFVLSCFGEQTADLLWEKCYPGLDEEIRNLRATAANPEELMPEIRERIRQAVVRERNRPLEKRPIQDASTELGATVARALGTSGTVADHYVQQVAKQILDKLPVKKDKLN